MTEYEFVKELGEGVDRVYREMEDAGLPMPEYSQSEFMLYATLRNKNWGKEEISALAQCASRGFLKFLQTSQDGLLISRSTGIKVYAAKRKSVSRFCVTVYFAGLFCMER